MDIYLSSLLSDYSLKKMPNSYRFPLPYPLRLVHIHLMSSFYYRYSLHYPVYKIRNLPDGYRIISDEIILLEVTVHRILYSFTFNRLILWFLLKRRCLQDVTAFQMGRHQSYRLLLWEFSIHFLS